MIRWIVTSSVRFRLLVVAVAAAAMVVGVSQLRDMPVEVLPDFTPATVEIQTEALGLSASEVEQLITVPLEQDLLNGVAFLEDIRSESVSGLSRILLVFESGTDLYRARQVVAERLTQAHALPQVSKPPQMLQPLASTNRLMLVSVSSDTVSALDMSVLAKWTIAPRLIGVPGVSNVAVWGQQERQLQVQVDPERLRAQGVTLLDVIKTAGNALWVSPLSFVEASTPGTGGFIDTPNQRLGIQHLSPVTTAADLAKVRVESEQSDKKLSLGDVSNVVEGHQPLIGDAVVNNDRGGLMLVVEKFPDANALDVTRNVEAAISGLKPGMSGVDFDTTVYRPASYIESSIDNLTLALIIGAVLAALVIGAFFLRIRTLLISLAVIPLSLVFAVLVLHALGTTMNALVLAGLAAALLIVIDDAVVDAENTARRLRQEREGANTSRTATIIAASLEVRSAAIYATLVVALAMVPVFFLEGLAGAFLPDLAGAYLVALIASMVVALTVTPALTVLLHSKGSLEGKEPRLAQWLQDRYGKSLSRFVGTPPVAYAVIGVVAVAGALAVPFLSTGLLPNIKESELLVRWDGTPGTSLPEMNRITALAGRELRTIPGVRDVGGHVGRAITGDQVVGVNSAELWVSMDPDADYDATLAAVNSTVAGYPGLSKNVQTYSNGRVREALIGADDDVVVRIYGEDLPTLRSESERVREAISGIDGVGTTRAAGPVEEPTLQIQVDLAKAQQHGIKPGDVRRAATSLLSGIHAGSLFEQQKVFEIVVWGVPEVRSSVTGVKNLLIDTPSGDHVRLGDVAIVRIVPSPAVIERESVSRYIDVAASLGGGDRDAVASDVERAVQGMNFPLEYHAAVLAVDQQPVGRLIAIGLATAIGMFLLLQAFFGSWRLATLTLLTLPIALSGGLLAALVDGGTLSFGSIMGLFAVFAIAARNSVQLLDRFRDLEEREGEAFGSGLVLRGARERLTPVLATAITTAAVFIPILALSSRAGFELLQPLGAVVLGGLVTSTVLALVVMPVLYLRFGFSRAAELADDAAQEDLAPQGAQRVVAGAPGAIAITETRATQDPTHE